MNAGSSNKNSVSPLSPTTVSEVEFSLKDGIREFMTDVAVAQAEGSNEVEAPVEIIKHFLPTGTPKEGYFWYQGVKVYEKGKKDEVEKRDNTSVEDHLFPKGAA